MTEEEAKQLKVGDKVRCINVNHSDYACIIGKTYKVVSVNKNGAPDIEAEGGIYWGLYGRFLKDFKVVKEDEPVFTKDNPRGYTTRGGHEVEIFCERDGNIYGRVKIGSTWASVKWNLDGRFYDTISSMDLIDKVVQSVTFNLQVEVKGPGYSSISLDYADHVKLQELPVGEYEVEVTVSPKDKV